MKNIYLLLAAGALILITSCGPTNVVVQSDSYQPAPVQDVSYQSFYDELSPYGNWINYPGYGYVWMPNAGPDFRPYSTNGSWIYTDAGWTWASNYNWGWAPFHYGRWFYENGYGWMWVPGNEWAPAWVSWRSSGDYYGWAPLSPRVSIEVGLNSYDPPVNYWNFVPRQYVGNPGWHNYYVNENRNITIINNTTIINNYSGTNRSQNAYAPGPDPDEVRRVSGNNFTPVQLRQANTPGERISGSQYMIYHPRVNATAPARGEAAGRPATPAPARYESFSNVRPSNQRPSYNQQNNNPVPANNQPSNNQRSIMQYPGSNQPANNLRPAAQNPSYNQPPNNPRAAAQNPSYNQPPNNPPANIPRPAMQNPYNQPSNNPPANSPRAAAQNPSYNQPPNNPPANNPRAAAQNPSYNQPNNQPTSNNQRPANQSPNMNQPAVQPNKPVNTRLNDARVNRFNQTRTNVNPVQTTTMPTPSPVNHVQTTGRPAADHNPNNGRPVQTTTPPQTKPDQKPTEKPKTREANSE